jgi:HK97 family phage prohead protease
VISPGLVVDWPARTIAGLAVPYGPIGRAFRRRWQFAPGVLEIAGLIRLLRDHDRSQRRGLLVDYADRDEGLWVRLLVDRNPAGDHTLALTADRLLGLSIGIEDGSETTRVGGVTVVHRAALEEISLVAVPAFKGGEQG